MPFIDVVVAQVVRDVENHNLGNLIRLLEQVPTQYLLEYLPNVIVSGANEAARQIGEKWDKSQVPKLAEGKEDNDVSEVSWQTGDQESKSELE